MIYKLQKKFIRVTAISIFAVIIVVFSLITTISAISLNKNLDMLTDNIMRGGGVFPDTFGDRKNDFGGEKPPVSDFITPETRFATRYFTVWINDSGEVTKSNTKSVYAITSDDAVEYAMEATKDGKERGWLDNYRYKIIDVQNERILVFVDGSQNLASFWQSVSISASVLVSCAVLVLLLIFLLSKKVVKPFADNYEKQKQFVTDANHELKTPLTLILANIDIAEAELGKNEWLDDMREEGARMTELINQLVALSRADEDSQKIERTKLPISEIVKDTVSDFDVLAVEKRRKLLSDIDSGIAYDGDEALIRRLLSILMDNALKYCDEGGEIKVTLKDKRNVTLCVENTYRDVNTVELDRLFDRFYRADKARTSGGFGVGLSIAKAIVQKHRGEITAYKKDDTTIGFRVILK